MALAGLAIAFGLRENLDERDESEVVARSERGTSGHRSASARRPRSVREFKAAWESLPDLKLTSKERLAAQRKMLAAWAEVDLRGAMQAVVASDWGQPGGLSGANYDTKGPLASALETAIGKHPGESWDIIRSGELGLGGSMLRHAWYDGVGRADPASLAGVYGEVSWREQETVLGILKVNATSDGEKQAAVLAALRAVPEDQLSAQQILQFMPEQSAEELTTAFQETEDFANREGKVTVLRYGKQAYGGFMRNEPDEETLIKLGEDVAGLPKEVAGELIYGILTDNGARVWGAGVKQTTGLVELLIEQEQWDKVGRKEVSETWKEARGMTPQERAAWAVTLPEREETTELFHRGVDSYIAENMQEAWDWMEDFPAGRWRDRAFSEYSQQALQKHQDYEASRRALDQIADPGFKTTAESWRPGWAKERD